VTVLSANDDPQAEADAFTVDEDSADNVLDVLANDSDADNDTLTVLSAGNTSHSGVVNLTNGEVRYTPAPDFFGEETFTYTVSDGQGGQDTATVTVTVSNINDDPQGGGDVYTVQED